GVAARCTEGLVVGHDDTAEGQVAAGVPDAATVVGTTVGDRQVVDGHADAARDPEHAALVAAADGHPFGAGPVDGQVVGDVQLAAGRGDGPAGSGGEFEAMVLGMSVGVEDRLPQRAGAVVGEVLDQERAGDGAILQRLQPGDVARPRPPGREVAASRPAAPPTASQAWEQSSWPHGCALQYGAVCGTMETPSPGRADRAPGRCQAGEGPASRRDLTGRCCFPTERLTPAAAVGCRGRWDGRLGPGQTLLNNRRRGRRRRRRRWWRRSCRRCACGERPRGRWWWRPRRRRPPPPPRFPPGGRRTAPWRVTGGSWMPRVLVAPPPPMPPPKPFPPLPPSPPVPPTARLPATSVRVMRI